MDLTVAGSEGNDKSPHLKCYARKVAGNRVAVRLPDELGGGTLMVYASLLSDLIAGRTSECWFVHLPDSDEWKMKKKNR